MMIKHHNIRQVNRNQKKKEQLVEEIVKRKSPKQAVFYDRHKVFKYHKRSLEQADKVKKVIKMIQVEVQKNNSYNQSEKEEFREKKEDPLHQERKDKKQSEKMNERKQKYSKQCRREIKNRRGIQKTKGRREKDQQKRD